MKFSKENQPPNRGRKATGQLPTMSVSVKPEVKEWYSKRKGLAGRVLDEYKRNNDK